MTSDRLALLRHLRDHGDASISGLADALGRSPKSLEDDVMELERAGLVMSNADNIKIAGDRIEALIELV